MPTATAKVVLHRRCPAVHMVSLIPSWWPPPAHRPPTKSLVMPRRAVQPCRSGTPGTGLSVSAEGHYALGIAHHLQRWCN